MVCAIDLCLQLSQAGALTIWLNILINPRQCHMIALRLWLFAGAKDLDDFLMQFAVQGRQIHRLYHFSTNNLLS